MAITVTSNYDTYEKLLQTWLLCRETVQVYSLYKKFFEQATSKSAGETAIILSNICYDHVILNWAKLCGACSQSLHFKNVFQGIGFSADMVRDNFLNAINCTGEEYQEIWGHLCDLRNWVVAHFDFSYVYKFHPNDQFFNKIPVQCRSIAKSVVRAFEEEYKQFPQRTVRINILPEPVLLCDVVSHLKTEWRESPNG